MVKTTATDTSDKDCEQLLSARRDSAPLWVLCTFLVIFHFAVDWKGDSV